MMLTKPLFWHVFLFSSILILFVSCEKRDNYSNIEFNYQYEGEFSFQALNTEVSLPDFGKNLPSLWIDNPALLQLLDTIQYESQIPFSFKDLVNEESKIKKITFVISVHNDFPAKSIATVYLADYKMEVKDTLHSSVPILIHASTLNSDGSIVRKGEHIQVFEISKSQFQKWSTMRNIIIKGYFENNSNLFNYHKFYSTYRIKMDMGLQIQFNFNFSELKSKQ
jgi:hypothetical protein